MPEARQVEPGLLPTEVNRQSFFSKGYYDARFLKTEYQVFCPTTTISPLGPGKHLNMTLDFYMHLNIFSIRIV